MATISLSLGATALSLRYFETTPQEKYFYPYKLAITNDILSYLH